ncbi:MAG: dihydrofolate reductase [Planctomycetota bacterium]
MITTLIAAMSENHVIARNGDLPWRLPTDLKRFKHVTLGHPIIMGRKTMDTLPAPLSGRHSIVVTRQKDWSADGVVVVHSLEAAFEEARRNLGDDGRVYVVGGGQIYADAIDQADELDLTRVLAEVAGDTHFPPINKGAWSLVSSEKPGLDDRHSHPFQFELWKRNTALSGSKSP